MLQHHLFRCAGIFRRAGLASVLLIGACSHTGGPSGTPGSGGSSTAGSSGPGSAGSSGPGAAGTTGTPGSAGSAGPGAGGTGGTEIILPGSGGSSVAGTSGTAGSAGSGTGGPGGSGTAGASGSGAAGTTGAGGTAMKMSCGDNPTFQLDHSPGYPDAQHQANLAAAQTLRNSLSLTEKAEQMRGVYGGNTSAQYSDINRGYDNTSKGIRGWQFRDGPRGVNYDATIAAGSDRGNVGTTTSQHGKSTVFPTPVARGAAFDVDLEYRIGQAMGDEAAAGGQTMILAPCVNVLRHPFWGRSQETYGEDNFLLGRIGTGLTAGIQEYVAACVKHFAANNIEQNRANNNSMMDNQTLREIYGRHFDMIINDGGVACVMAAYNSVNGTKSTQNSTLLTSMLRTEFNFKGLVLTDWWAMPGGQNQSLDAASRRSNAGAALAAGLDLELPWSLNYSVLESNFTDADLNPHVDRLLEQKIRLKIDKLTGPLGGKAPTTTFANNSGITGNDAHITIAEEAARKGMVLLKNCPNSNKACAAPDMTSVLPLSRTAIHSIAVVGATENYYQVMNGSPGINNRSDDVPNNGTINFATGIRIGDVGSSRVTFDPAKSTGPFAGVCLAAGGTPNGSTCSGGSISVTTATTSGTTTSAAVSAAMAADFTVVVVGLTPYDEGEEYNGSGDRSSLSLDGKNLGYAGLQNMLVQQVAALGKPMVVVIEAGSAIDVSTWEPMVPAIVMAWYPGMAGGKALGKLLFGDENFSGKLPITWPSSGTQLPPFGVSNGTTTMDYFLGYRRFDQMGMQPLYPFGWGLSYASFQYSNLQVPCSDVTKNGVINMTVDVQNTGARGGEEVVMVFVSFPTGPTGTPRRSAKELKAFYRVVLDGQGQTANCRGGSGSTPCASGKRITIPLRIADLKYYDMTSNAWQVQTGTYKVMVGPNAGSLPLSDTFVVK